ANRGKSVHRERAVRIVGEQAADRVTVTLKRFPPDLHVEVVVERRRAGRLDARRDRRRIRRQRDRAYSEALERQLCPPQVLFRVGELRLQDRAQLAQLGALQFRRNVHVAVRQLVRDLRDLLRVTARVADEQEV